MTAARPSTARKITPRVEAARAASFDVGISITYQGETYTVRSGDLTALDSQALRKELGMSFVGLMNALGADPDIDLIAGVVWLGKRLGGDNVSYAMVASQMGYDALDGLNIEQVAGPEVVDGNPED